MTAARHTLVGTIRVDPAIHRASAAGDAAAQSPAGSDDSTLGLLLESLAFQETLASGAAPRRLVVSTRISRYQNFADPPLAVEANLSQLALDLARDHQRLKSVTGSRA